MSRPSLLAFIPYRDVFALDVRSLALFRILLASLLIIDWGCRLPDLSAHYTDQGIVPRDLLAVFPTSFSLHTFSGAYWYQTLLAALALTFALGLLVGYQTPLMCLFSFILVVSVHGRNPALMQGGDHLMRAMLFWSIFLPLGARFSLDARSQSPEPNVHHSLAGVALILQIVFVYLFAAVFKWDVQWREEASAVYRTLTNEQFTTRVGYLVRSQPWLCSLLTHFTIYLETLGPIALFLPFHVGTQRLVVIVLFAGFHAGLAQTMELDTFPFLGIFIWSSLIPSTFWDRLGPQLPDLTAYVPRRPVPTGDTRPPSGPVPTAVVGLAFTYVALFNIHGYLVSKSNYSKPKRDYTFLPASFSTLGTVTGLEQGWGLFAPRPTPMGGWHMAIGTLADGSTVELMRGTRPADHSKPPMLSTTYPNARWRKLIQCLGDPLHNNYLPPGFARWMLEKWNREHPDEPLVQVDLLYAAQPTFPPGEDTPPAPEIFIIGYSADGIYTTKVNDVPMRWRLKDGKFFPLTAEEKADP